MTLKKKSGTTWVNVQSWSGSGTGSASLSKTPSIASGVTYKLFVTATIKYGSSSETISKESTEVTG